MQSEEIGVGPKLPFDSEIIEKKFATEKFGYDNPANKNSIESTVIWIGKDSESESIEYLEECNTHQSGE